MKGEEVEEFKTAMTHIVANGSAFLNLIHPPLPENWWWELMEANNPSVAKADNVSVKTFSGGPVVTTLAGAIPALHEKVHCPHCTVSSAPTTGDAYDAWRACLAARRFGGLTLANAIVHLNDSCGWSRERIADWLETLDLDLQFSVPDQYENFITRFPLGTGNITDTTDVDGA